jgi:hypothetical protein
MALMLSPAAPAAFSVVAPCNGKAAATRRIRLGSRSLRKVVAMADMLGDFGARDPFPEEIASEWGEKTLGNVDTLHRILIPTVSVLSLSRVPLQADPELLSQDDARRLLHKVVGWRLLFPCTHDNHDDLLKLECVWKVKDQACGEELVSRITRALESGAGAGGYVPEKLGFEAPNQVRAQLYSTSLGKPPYPHSSTTLLSKF